MDTPRQDLHFRGRNLGCVSCSWPGQMVHSSGTLLKCHYCVQIKPKAKGLEPFPFVLHLKEFRENKTISGPFFFFLFQIAKQKEQQQQKYWFVWESLQAWQDQEALYPDVPLSHSSPFCRWRNWKNGWMTCSGWHREWVAKLGREIKGHGTASPRCVMYEGLRETSQEQLESHLEPKELSLVWKVSTPSLIIYPVMVVA